MLFCFCFGGGGLAGVGRFPNYPTGHSQGAHSGSQRSQSQQEVELEADS